MGVRGSAVWRVVSFLTGGRMGVVGFERVLPPCRVHARSDHMRLIGCPSKADDTYALDGSSRVGNEMADFGYERSKVDTSLIY